MKRGTRSATGCALTFLAAACGGGGGGGGGASTAPSASPPASLPGSPPSPSAPKPFVDATPASGIDYSIGYRTHPGGLVPEFATGGVAAGDYDGDGDVDLFITRGDIGSNLLYRNDGRGVFTDVAAAAGIAFTANARENYRHSGPAFADMDGDRDLDLFIGGLFDDPSFIYANNGDGTFTNVTPGSGIDALQARQNISAAFGDYDLDGDLDLFVAHWGTIRDPAAPGDTEHLWRNDSANGVIRFSSVSVAAGIAPGILPPPEKLEFPPINDYTFTPSFARIDGDLYPDILSVADYYATRVFINGTDGTFRDATDPAVITDANGMGSALGDFDNDGDLDWFVSAIYSTQWPELGNRMYRNDGGVFVDATNQVGVQDGAWGWGACFADLENDGDLDIYHTNGWGLGNEEYLTDRSRAFVNRGDGTFVPAAAQLGLDDPQQGRGVVCTDFDGDGDIDILQLHRDPRRSVTYWRNDERSRNYLAVKLHGRPPNTQAAGARIYATVGTVTQMREIIIGSNFVSQNPVVQHFGLGSATQVDELRVQWPDGSETRRTAVAAGQRLSIDQPPGAAPP